MANVLEQIGQLIRAGRFNDAEQGCQQVLAQAPDQPHALYFLGMIALNRGESTAAVSHFDAAIAQAPEVVEFHLNRGIALLRDRQLEAAEQALTHCLALKPDDVWVMANLAMLATERGQKQEAVDWLRKALALQPEMWELKYNLANALRRVDQHEEANELYQDVLEVRGQFQHARNNLAGCLRAQGRVTEANATFRRMTKAAAQNPDGWQNLLIGRQYDPSATPGETYELAGEFAKACAGEIEPLPPATVDRTPGRKLRVGFLGASYYNHPHGVFLLPVVKHLDRAQFEVHIFDQRIGQIAEDDPVRGALQQHADHWHETAGLGPKPLVERIRRQSIDILIETTRHLEGSQLLTMAHESATVQVSWMGGPQITTGLAGIGYLLTDADHVPEGNERFYAEQIVRLPGDYLCWHPPFNAGAVAEEPPSATQGRRVTFGYFGQLAKVSRPVLDAWARILADCPDAQLLLKQGPLRDEGTAARWREILNRAAIEPERVRFEGGEPHEQWLHAYGRVDIALDSFPYAGGVTTLEALWMGVPVISMPWPNNPVASHGVSHLRAADCGEMLADDVDDYIAKAVALAGDAGRLADYRQSLRERVAQSAMCDGTAYAVKFGEALQGMWAKV